MPNPLLAAALRYLDDQIEESQQMEVDCIAMSERTAFDLLRVRIHLHHLRAERDRLLTAYVQDQQRAAETHRVH
jgi:hypothetical protein